MVFYDRKPSQILVDLINESNPDLGIGLRHLENTRLTTPRPYPTVRTENSVRVIKAFTSVGEATLWEPPEGVTHIDLLVVAGGGGGGNDDNWGNAGGGAGGLIFIPNMPVSADGKYWVKVGAGGNPGFNGEDSLFGDLRAIGGGAGAPMLSMGNEGGSGGGAYTDDHRGGRGRQPFQFGPSGEYGFGNPGYNSHHRGGGGAGQGGDATVWSLKPGEDFSGGDGLCMVTPEMGPYHRTYRFAEVFGTDYGEIIDGEAWFAGGGAAARLGSPAYVGGRGGGGNGGWTASGAYDRPAQNGMATTGGGGGGKRRFNPCSGGSGIVLIAYNNPLTNQEGYKYDHINTVIDVYPKPGQPVKGKATFYYRRLDLGNIFKNKVVRFDRWRESNIATIEDICGWLNQEYGTEFIPEDFPAQTFSPSAAIRTITVVPESYAYTGNLRFIWNPGKRDLDQIFETYNIDGYIWDHHHGGEVDSRPLLMFTGYGVDYTEFNDLIGFISNGSTLVNNSTPIGILIERYNKLHGTELSLDIPHTEPNGLAGLTVTRHALPATIVDEANSERFLNVVAITSREDSWFGGRILFHHNPR